MPAVEVYLVRHGEAAIPWSKGADAGLSAIGQQQAARVAREIRELGAFDVITSPLLRAQETAASYVNLINCLARIEAKFQEVPLNENPERRRNWLKEVNTMTWRDVPQSIAAWREDAWTALHSLERNSVVFTHFMLINALVTRVTGEDRLVAFEPDYASITRIRLDGAGACRVVARGAAIQKK